MLASALLSLGVSLPAQDTVGPTIELEAFIVDETAAALLDSLVPTDRELDGIFLDGLSVMTIPRSITVLSPEALAQFDIQALDDLDKVGAGTQRINYFGIAGTPVLRGVLAGAYYNGMLRAYNRNQAPISFGSLEALNVVKGPTPAHLSLTPVGGYVDMLPKSPYFDEASGSVEFEIGRWEHYRIQGDLGGPFLLGKIPAAYRLSATAQQAESFYDNVGNDYASLYGALKMRPAEKLDIFTGFEYYRYESNENAGWNRPTQALIDEGRYVIGEPINITDEDHFGRANREPFAPFTTPVNVNPALVVPRSVVLSANLTAAQLEALNDLSDPAERMAAYGSLFGAFGGNPNVDGFQYTPEYFAAGGEVFTAEIEGSRVLADPTDRADADNFLFFADVVFRATEDRTFTLKGLYEYLATEKLSSYGYAFDGAQTVAALKLIASERSLDWLQLEYGGSLRYTGAQQLQDFTVEPFSRRDLTNRGISANSTLLAGAQSPRGGANYWDPFASGESDLYQAAVFAVGELRLGSYLSVVASARWEHADFEVALPGEIERASPSEREAFAANSGNEDYASWSVGPVFRPHESLSLYFTYQDGTVVTAQDGGSISGGGNFAEATMWEAGAKTSLFEGRLYGSLAVYQWEQSVFNDREGEAEPLEGEGVEVELTWLPTDWLTVIGSFTWQEVRRRSPLGFRTVPMTEELWALYGGELNSNFAGVTSPFSVPPGPLAGVDFGVPENNPELITPGFPPMTAKLFAVVERNGFGISGGPIYQEAFWLNFDRTIQLPEAIIWNASLFYRGETFEIRLRVENVFEEQYFYGSDPVFAANTLVTQAPGRDVKLSIRVGF